MSRDRWIGSKAEAGRGVGSKGAGILKPPSGKVGELDCTSAG